MATLLLRLVSGVQMKDALHGSQVGLGWIRPGTDGDLQYLAVLGSPPQNPMVTDLNVSGEDQAVLLGQSIMDGQDPFAPPVVWDLAGIKAQLDSGTLSDPQRLMGALLGDIGGGAYGYCHVDRIQRSLAAGTCPDSGGARKSVVWDLSGSPTNGSFPATQLPDYVIPALDPASDGSDWRSDVGGIIDIPNDKTIVDEHLYYWSAPGAQQASPLLSVTIYSRADTTSPWSAHHLKIDPNLALDGRGCNGTCDRPWNDDVTAMAEGFMALNAHTWNAGDGSIGQQMLVLATPYADPLTGNLLTWTLVNDGSSDHPLPALSGIVSLVDSGTGKLKRYAYAAVPQSSGSLPILVDLPDASALPADQSGVTALPGRVLPVPAGGNGRNYQFEGAQRRIVGDAQTDHVAIVASVREQDRAVADVLWFLAYDAVNGDVTIGEPQLQVSSEGDTLQYKEMSGGRVDSTYGTWTQNGGTFNGMQQTWNRSIEVAAHDRRWRTQFSRCDKTFFFGDSNSQQKSKDVSGPTSSSYVFAPDANLTAKTVLERRYSLSAPPWLDRRLGTLKRQNLAQTTDAQGRVFTLVEGLTKSDGEPYLAGLRYDMPESQPVAIDPVNGEALGLISLLSDHPSGAYGIGLLAGMRGPDANPITDAHMAIVFAQSNGTVAVKEPFDVPAAWGTGANSFVTKIDDKRGIFVVSDFTTFDRPGDWIDAWRPSKHAFYKPAAAFTYNDWQGFANDYPGGNGYDDATTLDAPSCTSCNGPDCMSCQIIAATGGKAIGKCIPTILCDDGPGFFYWNLLDAQTGGGGGVTPTRMPDPDPSAVLDPSAVQGMRSLTSYGERGVFLPVSDTFPVFLSSYAINVPPSEFQMSQTATATVIWQMDSGTTWASPPIVFLKGGLDTGGGQSPPKITDRYLYGNLYDEEGGLNATHAMVYEFPDQLAGHTSPTSWVRWSQLGLPDVGQFELASVLPGRGLVYGHYFSTFGGAAHMFAAELHGSDTSQQLAFGFPSDLSSGVPAALGWEPAAFADVRFDPSGTTKPQPIAMVDMGNGALTGAVFDLPDTLNGYTASAANTHVVEVPMPSGATKSAFSEGTVGLYPAVTTNANFAPRDTFAVVGDIFGMDAPGSVSIYTIRSALTAATNTATVVAMPGNIMGGGLVGGSSILPLAGPTGNQYSKDPDRTDAIYQYAVYHGDEQLDCGGVSCNKRYFNIALGFDPSRGCTVFFDATASDGTSFKNGQPPGDASYPALHYEVALSTVTDKGTSVCGENPLGGMKSGVQPVYLTPGPAGMPTFCYQLGPEEAKSGVVTDWCKGMYQYSDGGKRIDGGNYGPKNKAGK